MNINDIQASLEYLGETDEKYGTLKANYMAQKELLKSAYSLSFLETQTGSVEHRKAVSYSSARYITAVSDYRDACADYEILRAKRLSAELNIELYRSLLSAKKQGIVL